MINRNQKQLHLLYTILWKQNNRRLQHNSKSYTEQTGHFNVIAKLENGLEHG